VQHGRITNAKSIPVIRLQLPCADAAEYQRIHARVFAQRGVLIRSKRMRPVGTRVRLRIQLADGSFAHDGPAVVACLLDGPRPAYILELAEPAAERAAAEVEVAIEPPEPAAEPPRTPAPALTPPPGTVVRAGARLPDLFGDLQLPDALEDSGPIEMWPPPATARARRPTPTPTPVPRPAPRTWRPAIDPPRLARIDAEPRPRAPDAEEPGPAVAAPAQATLDEASSAEPVPIPDSEVSEVLPDEPAHAPGAGAPGLAAAPEDDAPEPTPLPAPTVTRTVTRKTWLLQRVRHIRHTALLGVAAVVCLAIGGGTLVVVASPSRAEARAADFLAEVRRADERIQAGRLAGAPDSALDHLVAARDLVPDDPRLATRLKLLADLFGELGERALSRGDLEEATAHFQARLRADPGNAAARRRLRELSDRATAPSPGRWVATGRPGARSTDKGAR
jgi:hypothetical protein